MEKEQIISAITEIVNDIIDESHYFITRIFIKPTNNVKLFLDGDIPVSIDVISKANKAIYKVIEEKGIFPDGDFSLEVSSPGVDEPLVDERQYAKHIGRNLAITDEAGNEIEGKFLSLEDRILTIEETINKKKKETKIHNIALDQVSKAVVQVQF